MIAALLGVAFAASLPGIDAEFDDKRVVTKSASDLKDHVGYTLVAVGEVPLEDWETAEVLVVSGDSAEVDLVLKKGSDEATVTVRPALTRILKHEKIALPEGAKGAMWRTTRNRQAWLNKGDTWWVVNPALGRVEDGKPGGEPHEYALPEHFWTLFEGQWVAHEALAEVDALKKEFAGSFLVNRWRHRHRDMLLKPVEGGLQVYEVVPSAAHGRFPSCETDLPETCVAAGLRVLAEMPSVPGAKKHAMDLFGLACEEDVPRGCMEALAHGDDAGEARRAGACIDGDGRSCEDLARGTTGTAHAVMLEVACDEGSFWACLQLRHARDDRMRAVLAEECDGADAQACYHLAALIELSHVEGDAFERYEQACKGGVEEACTSMASYVIDWGDDDPRVVRAVDDLEKACEANLDHSCVGAAHLLVRHPVKSKDYVHARTLYAEACSRGDLAGCLGGARHDWQKKAKKAEGLTVEQMLAKACELGHQPSCATPE